MSDFEQERRERIARLGGDRQLRALSRDWLREVSRHGYSYNFEWMGRPIIQFPQDVLAMQEILWSVRPQLVIETGVAHGGSLVLYASILDLIGEDGMVVGIDIEIRPQNRLAIEGHPMARRIRLIEGSSVDAAVVDEVRALAAGRRPVLVTLDSNHTHDHVRRELEMYEALVTKGSYLVVFDTVVEDLPEDFFPNRPWRPGNSPKTAVADFLKVSDRFEVDAAMESKLLVTVAPAGYLRCVKD